MIVCFAAIWIVLICVAVGVTIDARRQKKKEDIKAARELKYWEADRPNRVRGLEASIAAQNLINAALLAPDPPANPPPDPDDRDRVRRRETPVWEPREIVYTDDGNRNKRGGWVGDRSGKRWKEQQ